MKTPAIRFFALTLCSLLSIVLLPESCSNKHLVSIALTPADPSVSAIGQTIQFEAMGTTNHPNAGQEVLTNSATWSSSNVSVATISASGLATAVACGETNITAKDNNVVGQTSLTVACSAPGGSSVLQSVTVYPGTPTIPNPGQIQLKALGVYSPPTANNDLTSAAAWASSNLAVASVNNAGQVTAVACGTTTISAAYQGLIGQTQLTVSCASLEGITIYPSNPTIPQINQTLALKALGIYPPPTSNNDITNLANWASSNLGVATVSDTGLISAGGCGTTMISALYQSVIGQTQLTVSCSVLESIGVYPVNPTILENQTEQFTALATYSPANPTNQLTNVTWASSNNSVATINTTGLVTAVPSSCGTTTVSAESQGVVGQTQLTVSCPAVAPVLQSINLYPNSPTIPQVGNTVDFLALAVYSPAQPNNDVTSQVTWRSGNEGVVTVNAGLASAVSCGSTTIQAEYQGVVTQTPLTVQCASNLKSLAILPGSATIPQIGQTTQFEAIGTYNDGTQQDLTPSVSWSSSNLQIATLDANPMKRGLVDAVSCGTSTISAGSQNVVATAQLTVSCSPITSVELLVVKTGATPASIVSSPSGVDCGTTCAAEFNEGTGIILTATPAPVSWTNCDQVLSGRCSLTIRPDSSGGTLMTVTANY